jgi:hypothetical protein
MWIYSYISSVSSAFYRRFRLHLRENEVFHVLVKLLKSLATSPLRLSSSLVIGMRWPLSLPSGA